MPVLFARVAATLPSRQRLDAIPVEPACRRRRPHTCLRSDRLGQVDATFANRSPIPALSRCADLRLRQGSFDAAASLAIGGDHYEIGGDASEKGGTSPGLAFCGAGDGWISGPAASAIAGDMVSLGATNSNRISRRRTIDDEIEQSFSALRNPLHARMRSLAICRSLAP